MQAPSRLFLLCWTVLVQQPAGFVFSAPCSNAEGKRGVRSNHKENGRPLLCVINFGFVFGQHGWLLCRFSCSRWCHLSPAF